MPKDKKKGGEPSLKSTLPNESKNQERKVDQLIKNTFNQLGRNFVLVSKIKIKTWQSFLIIIFVAGFFSALIWAISREEVGKIYTAEEKIAYNQASLTYQNTQGTQYGPQVTNVVSTNIKPKAVVINTLKGKIRLEGRQDFSTTGLAIYFLQSGTENVIFQTTANAASDGRFTVGIGDDKVSAGTYDLKTKLSTYLSQKVSNINWPTDVEIDFGEARAGNIYGNDDVINSLDWSILNDNWESSNAIADINGDGIVNTIDWSFMNKNWNK